MVSDRDNPIDLESLFIWIGHIALNSSRNYITDHADLSDWLTTKELKGISDPNLLPKGFFRDLMMLEVQLEDQMGGNLFFPMLSQIYPIDQCNRVETTDLMVVTRY